MNETHPEQTGRHLYLFALEVTPLTVGRTYLELPLHCTLMFRFWSELTPDELGRAVRGVFDSSPTLVLVPYEHALLGPRRVGAHLVQKTAAITDLHMRLYQVLQNTGVTFTEPQWVDEGYKPHITDRPTEAIALGQPRSCHAVYLIEVIDGQRCIRAAFELAS